MDEVERPPWWLSGDDSASEKSSEGNDAGTSEPNWMSLLSSLGSLAGEWWATSGVGDHGNHGVATEHPECIVCRALVTVSSPDTPPRVLPAVRWLPIRRL